MRIELVPVIEIANTRAGLIHPDSWPKWEHADLWDNYHQSSLKKMGFIIPIEPYFKGLPIYTLNSFNEHNLTKVIEYATEGVRTGQFERDDPCPLSGGYVLRLDKQDVFYPQCCGDLSEIEFWERISFGKSAVFEMHPAPKYRFDNEEVIFNFEQLDKHSEPFEPPHPMSEVRLPLKELRHAVSKTKDRLNNLAIEMIRINELNGFNIEDIDEMLIYGR